MPSVTSVEKMLQEEQEREDGLEEARRLRKAARSLADLKAENRNLHKAIDVLEEHLEVRKALAKAISKPPVVKYKKIKNQHPVIPIVSNNDEHYDETFTLAETGGINEQNPDIAEEKVERFIQRSLNLIKREMLDSPVPYVVMPMLGDMIAGELHAKSERNSPMTPIEASRFAYKLKRKILDSYLAFDIPEIIIPAVDGNHGRTTAKRTPGLNARYSHENDIYLRLADHYEEINESRIKFYIPGTDFASIKISKEFTLCVTHGDSVRGGQGIGGIAPSLLRAVSRWKDAYPADMYLLGHHHQYWDLNHVCMSPSAVGYDPYAASLGLSPSPPAQLFTTLHTGRNMRATTAPIWL